MECIFPDKLDNARVLFYTPKGDYGKMYYDNGEIAACFSYLAICKYDDDRNHDKGYYLFYCNENKEVETDDFWHSIEECMSVAENSCEGRILWIEK